MLHDRGWLGHLEAHGCLGNCNSTLLFRSFLCIGLCSLLFFSSSLRSARCCLSSAACFAFSSRSAAFVVFFSINDSRSLAAAANVPIKSANFFAQASVHFFMWNISSSVSKVVTNTMSNSIVANVATSCTVMSAICNGNRFAKHNSNSCAKQNSDIKQIQFFLDNDCILSATAIVTPPSCVNTNAFVSLSHAVNGHRSLTGGSYHYQNLNIRPTHTHTSHRHTHTSHTSVGET